MSVVLHDWVRLATLGDGAHVWVLAVFAVTTTFDIVVVEAVITVRPFNTF
jgi:hypothetical protein